MSEERNYMDEAREAGIAIEGLTLTEAQVKRFVEVVTSTAKERSKMLGVVGAEFHDCDFAMGAAVILFATGNNDKVPPAWIFNAMRGVPVFEAEGSGE